MTNSDSFGPWYDPSWASEYRPTVAQVPARHWAPTSNPTTQYLPHPGRVTAPAITIETSGLPPPDNSDIYSSGNYPSSSTCNYPASTGTLSPCDIHISTPAMPVSPVSPVSRSGATYLATGRRRASSDSSLPYGRSSSIATSQLSGPPEALSPPPRSAPLAVDHGSPPRDQHDEIICTYDDTCVGVTFPRKCEWR